MATDKMSTTFFFSPDVQKVVDFLGSRLGSVRSIVAGTKKKKRELHSVKHTSSLDIRILGRSEHVTHQMSLNGIDLIFSLSLSLSFPFFLSHLEIWSLFKCTQNCWLHLLIYDEIKIRSKREATMKMYDKQAITGNKSWTTNKQKCVGSFSKCTCLHCLKY